MSAQDATHLLLVEDDIGIGRLLQRGLVVEGYTVDWVRDLRSATQSVRDNDHELIILDRMLPDGDGAAFCSAIRRTGNQVPICILTAREALEDKLRGFEAGADDYIVKPFEFDELLARLQVMLRRAAATPKEAPTPFIDPAQRSISIGAARATFTKREWPLMLFLMEHEGEALSRSRLIDDAWKMSGEVTENSVDVYIGYLRRKITDTGLPLRIETVRGIGFRLDHR